MNRNPECSGSHCTSEHGETRMLRLDKSGESNNQLCRACFEHEMEWRRSENRRLGRGGNWQVPEWSELEVASR